MPCLSLSSTLSSSLYRHCHRSRPPKKKQTSLRQHPAPLDTLDLPAQTGLRPWAPTPCPPPHHSFKPSGVGSRQTILAQVRRCGIVMELNTTRANASPLLSEPDANRARNQSLDVEDIAVEQMTSREKIATVCAGICMLNLCIALIFIFAQVLRQESYLRAWLLLACVAPLSWAAQRVWDHVCVAVDEWRHIRVEIDSLHSATLFNALTDRIEQAAESKTSTCSSDVQGGTTYDKKTWMYTGEVQFLGESLTGGAPATTRVPSNDSNVRPQGRPDYWERPLLVKPRMCDPPSQSFSGSLR